jgi:hypothetical protein
MTYTRTNHHRRQARRLDTARHRKRSWRHVNPTVQEGGSGDRQAGHTTSGYLPVRLRLRLRLRLRRRPSLAWAPQRESAGATGGHPHPAAADVAAAPARTRGPR